MTLAFDPEFAAALAPMDEAMAESMKALVHTNIRLSARNPSPFCV